MENATAQHIKLRKFRDMPFCWQDKEALRLIRDRLPRKEQSSARNIYLALTEIASDKGTDNPAIFLQEIAYYSGISERTIRKHLNSLAKLGLVTKPPQEKNADGKYKPVKVGLVSVGEEKSAKTTTSPSETSGKDRGKIGTETSDIKKVVKSKITVSSKEDRKQASKSSQKISKKEELKHGNQEIQEFKKIVLAELGVNLIGKYRSVNQSYWNALMLLTPRNNKGEFKEGRKWLADNWRTNLQTFLKRLKMENERIVQNIQYADTLYSQVKFYVENNGQL